MERYCRRYICAVQKSLSHGAPVHAVAPLWRWRRGLQSGDFSVGQCFKHSSSQPNHAGHSIIVNVVIIFLFIMIYFFFLFNSNNNDNNLTAEQQTHPVRYLSVISYSVRYFPTLEPATPAYSPPTTQPQSTHLPSLHKSPISIASSSATVPDSNWLTAALYASDIFPSSLPSPLLSPPLFSTAAYLPMPPYKILFKSLVVCMMDRWDITTVTLYRDTPYRGYINSDMNQTRSFEDNRQYPTRGTQQASSRTKYQMPIWSTACSINCNIQFKK